MNCPYCEFSLTPHEIGILFARVSRLENSHRKTGRYGGAKLATKDVKTILRSKKPTRELAKKYNVSFQTIWRVRKNKTYKSQGKLNCPHCGHKLTPKEIHSLLGKIGGSRTSPRKHEASSASIKHARRYVTKLTWKDVNKIRRSKLSTGELAKEYGVTYNAIWKVRKFLGWKSQTTEE